MPYRRRTETADVVFHVLNRAVRRAQLFQSDEDYAAFLRAFLEAQDRIPLRLLAYCVMPNHFHLVVWPKAEGELSRFMQWFTATHSKRWHVDRGTTGTGSVYQGRFKAFPVQTDSHFLAVCRYVERNPLRAGLVTRADSWSWSSYVDRRRGVSRVHLAPWPVPEPPEWADMVQADQAAADLAALRRAVVRSAPYGETEWARRTAAALGPRGSVFQADPRGRHRISG